MNEYSGMIFFCFIICCYLMGEEGVLKDRINKLDARVTALELRM